MNKLASICTVVVALAAGCNSGQTGGDGSNSGSNTGGTTTGALLAGAVTTLAGNGMLGLKDGSGGRNGVAEFDRPEGVTADSSGNVFVADTKNNVVRMIDPSGNVTTLQNSASFVLPAAIAADAHGFLYVAVSGAHQIWKIDAAGAAQILAGNGMSGDTNGLGGPSGQAEFRAPVGVAVDSAGNVYVADDDRVRKIDVNFNVTTLAGNGADGFADGTGGSDGEAEFSSPLGLAADASGNVYVADSNNNRIRKIDSSGNVTTVAGNGTEGYRDGSGGEDGGAEFFTPSGVAVDGSGNVFVADTANNFIRRIDASGNVTTWAGLGVAAFADAAQGLDAAFNNPTGIGLTPNGGLVVADQANECIRLIAP